VDRGGPGATAQEQRDEKLQPRPCERYRASVRPRRPCDRADLATVEERRFSAASSATRFTGALAPWFESQHQNKEPFLDPEPTISLRRNPSPCRHIRSQDGNPRPLSTKHNRPLFSTVWKTRPEPRTKPVIARDTTYSVSLLTGTICGSNFAIPSTENSASREWDGVSKQESCTGKRCGPGVQPEVTRHPPQAKQGSGAWASRSVSPAPKP